MESSNTSPNKAIIGIIVVVLIAIAATAVIVTTNKKDDTSSTNDSATTQSADTADTSSTADDTADSANSAADSSATFKDGTYTATGSYQTPGGQESIDLTVTLSGNTVTDAKVVQNASGGEAAEYQSKFASGYKSLVVGKKITDVSLTRVAGSSLTPVGFNNAIQDIENQAKA